MAWSGTPAGHRNQFTAGAAFDRSSVDFLQSSQLGYLNPDRSITGVNSFGDGVHGGNVDGAPYDTRVDLHGLIHTGSVYGTDTLSIGNTWNFTLSGRYNRTTIDNKDRIQPVAGSGSLTSRNTFDRFNPAAGITFSPVRSVNAYFGYNEGSRAPTSTELGCADPNQPCKLPNAMAGDPPLRQVVTRTVEAGIRGEVESNLKWSIGWFHGEKPQRHSVRRVEPDRLRLFQELRQDAPPGSGNRRQRPHVARHARRRLHISGRDIPKPGDGRRLQQQHQRCGGGRRQGARRIHPNPARSKDPAHPAPYAEGLRRYPVDVEVPGGPRYDGAVEFLRARQREQPAPARRDLTIWDRELSPGYAVVNLGARYQVSRLIQLFVQVNNLFDRQYYSAAQLGPTGFSSQGNFIARPFPAVDGEFPVQHATFYAPGGTAHCLGGMRFRF